MRANWEIVLRALQQQPGERTVCLDGCDYGWHDDKLCHILYKWNDDHSIFNDPPDEELWVISDISLNTFIKLCEGLTESEIVGLAASAALYSMRRKR